MLLNFINLLVYKQSNKLIKFNGFKLHNLKPLK